MAIRNGNGEGLHFSWAALGTLIALGFVIAGGGWTLLQTQIIAVSARYDGMITAIAEKENLRHANTDRQLEELQKHFNRIDAILERRESVFLNQDEFKQFSLRFDAALKQLNALEATRPTVGELQAVAKAADDRISRLTDRVNALELSSRPPQQRN